MSRRSLKAVRRDLALRTRLERRARRAVRARGRRAANARKAAPLLASPLFDADWFNLQTGRSDTPEKAALQYLKNGRKRGFTPHPLFDPDFVADRLGLDDEEVDEVEEPLLAFLARKDARKGSTHPLFDAKAYVKAVPEAKKHPYGPVGHYLESGAAAGVAPNDWYRPDPTGEPGGLADWIRATIDAWRERRTAFVALKTPGPTQADAAAARARYGAVTVERSDADQVPVSVVLAVRNQAALLPVAVDSVLAQTFPDFELVVVDDGSEADLAAALGARLDDPRVRLVRQESSTGVAGARNRGLAEATGAYVAFLDADIIWEPDHLQLCLGAIRVEKSRAAFDVLETTTLDDELRWTPRDVTRAQLETRAMIDQSSLVVERDLAIDIDFDTSLPRAVNHAFTLELAARTPLTSVAVVGGRTDERWGHHDRLAAAKYVTWNYVVLNDVLIDWKQLAERGPVSPGTVSVIIPTFQDWEMTTAAVRSVVAAAKTSGIPVQVIVVDNGSRPNVATALAALPARFDGVTVLHSPVNRGFGLGNNLALAHVTGDVVVFLNNDTEVDAGWLEPLLEALRDPEIHGAQSLLVYPGGAIQSAGVAFPVCGGIPHVLLQGFPVEDAQGMEHLPLRALTGAAIAMRYADVVELRGFDPIFLNGMEDVDLGLRMEQLRPGRFTVRPDSVVTHFESRSPGRFTRSIANRKILLDRWDGRMPADDVDLWADRGFDVVAHEARYTVENQRRYAVPEPVILRPRPALSVTEPAPRLRWALKNPAPPGPEAEIWGDTHFARSLAAALREKGQEVVIDHRPEFERASGRFDDVSLLLRGVAGFSPIYGQVSMLWIISHPEMVSAREVKQFDRAYSASVSWSAQASERWGVRIDPLLQATDPTRFTPDAAEPDTGDAVLFVGSSRNVMRPMVRDAIDQGLDLSVYGGNWKRFIPDSFVKASYLPNEQVGAAYRSAGVVLNDHWEDMRVAGFLSNRLFDAAASGARVVTDDVAGLGTIFGRSVQVARTPEDLVRLSRSEDLDAIFGDDAERRAVAERIHREHSFAARAEQLIEDAARLRRPL